MAGGIDRAAVARARGVVGLYGDPTVSWSIGLDVRLSRPVAAGALEARCQSLAAGAPGLGARPVPGRFAVDEAAPALARLLDAPYGDRDPLVRVLLRADGRQVMVAAHHGAVDGLGLLAVLAHLLDSPLASTARGIGSVEAEAGFLRSAVARLAEALVRPPDRLAPETPKGRVAGSRSRGDVTARVDRATVRVNTAGIVAAAASAFADWNAAHGARSRRTVVAIGASRRDGADARPDRDTAYLRIRLPAEDLDPDAAGAAIAATPPEPSFPERPVGRWAGLLTRALRSRLGSSLLVSNLGLVDVPPGIEQIAFYPSAAGPRALAVGVASTPSYTTLTVRLPAADFSADAAARIAASIGRRLSTGRTGPDGPAAGPPGEAGAAAGP